MKCWICGDPADSEEHKFKKSDLKKSSATWKAPDLPYFVSGSEVRRIPGQRSSLITFGKILCRNCNSSRTQPYDLAYERFAEWVNDMGAAIMAESHIDFADIYGLPFENGVLNLLKYFAKHLGSRLASDDYTIPIGLAPSLTTNELTPFSVSLSRNNTLGDLPVRGPGILNNFPLLGHYSPSTRKVFAPYISGMVVGHLDVVYRYNYSSHYSWEGDPIVITDQRVRLGQYEDRGAGEHPTNGSVPGASQRRSLRIGGQKFNLPLLTPEHMEYVLSLQRPSSGMTFDDNITARLKIAHAILSPLYPDITLEFLKENLTIPDSDALWNCVFKN